MNSFFEESVLIHWADCSEFQQPNGVAGHEGRQYGNHCRTLSIFAGNVRGPAVFRMDCDLVNTKEIILPVGDKPYQCNKTNVQKREEIEI